MKNGRHLAGILSLFIADAIWVRFEKGWYKPENSGTKLDLDGAFCPKNGHLGTKNDQIIMVGNEWSLKLISGKIATVFQMAHWVQCVVTSQRCLRSP